MNSKSLFQYTNENNDIKDSCQISNFRYIQDICKIDGFWGFHKFIICKASQRKINCKNFMQHII